MPQNNSCIIRYEYDPLNRIKRAILGPKLEIIYEYDAAGNITRVEKKEKPGEEDNAG
jgi:hypothetical protein